jgi:hypothetical protein
MGSISLGGVERLITAGCSFTKHCWPTWADYLGKHYEWHKQLGRGGHDNANIARSVINTAKQGDTVIIMWTGYDRWNTYDNEWQHNGCLVGDKMFYTNYYSPVERFTTTMDYIQLVDKDSKLKGYTCYHFNAFNWFLSETHNEIPERITDIFMDYDDISNLFVMGQSLLEYQEKNNELFTVSHKYDRKDTHPTPITHWNYLNKHIVPKLTVTIDSTHNEHVINDQNEVMSGTVN